MKEGLAPVLSEINHLLEHNSINVAGEVIDLDFVLGADYKFLLHIMGFNAANSIYACIYCTVKKDER